MTARTAELRCYAELEDLIDPQRRGSAFQVGFDGSPTVKDVVEAAGVPHTEIDLVVVDGEPVDLDHHLHGGERVVAYPHFRSLDVRGALQSADPSARPPAFVVDVHLGTLARDLRLLGFDTAWGNDWDDDHLAELAVADGRVLLTRDRGLLKRGEIVDGMYVRDDEPVQQLIDVVRRFGLGDLTEPFSRCLVCNGTIVDVDVEEVADQLEPRTRRHFDRFRRCTGCGRVYWRGSHHEQLQQIVDEVEHRLSSVP